jgi:hypothetical protein
MLAEDIKPNEKDKQIVDDLMDELENLGAKAKSAPSIKHEDEDEAEYKKKKKHHRHRSPDSKHDRKKSRYNIDPNLSILFKHCFIKYSHKDRKRRRHSSTGSNSSNRSNSSDNSRSPSPKHHRSSKKTKHHDRNESPPRRKGPPVPDKPVPGSIYDGTVISIMQWGCFVRLDQFRNRTEGLVHISQVNI